MSHFATLVILTPDYATKHDLDDSLAKYDENLEVEEYSRGEVSKFEKIRFVDYYSKKYKGIIEKSKKLFYEKLVKDGVIEPFVSEEVNGMDKERYIFMSHYDRENEFAEFILASYPRLLNHFKRMYDKHGWDWDNNSWRINPDTRKWEEYSTYNPLSKWDWYAIGNRWDGYLKTKSGEYVNTCYLNEIDWTDFTEGVKYHLTRSNIPGYLVVDGEWHEKFKGLWFGMTDDKMSEDEWKEKFFSIIDNLPSDSEVTIVDVHI